MAGKRSPQRPSLSQLTSPPDKLCSNSRSLRYANSHHIPDGTKSAIHRVVQKRSARRLATGVLSLAGRAISEPALITASAEKWM